MGSGGSKKGGGGGSNVASPPIVDEEDAIAAAQKNLQLFIVGTAGSGKSTICKQILIGFGAGLDDETKEGIRLQIRRNIINRLYRALQIFLKSVKKEEQNTVEWVMFYDAADRLQFVDDEQLVGTEGVSMGKLMVRLLLDPGFFSHFEQTAAKNHEENLVHESIKTYIAAAVEEGKTDMEVHQFQLVKLFSPDYVLTFFDVMHVRFSTVDVQRNKFSYENREWSLVDLGGQVHLRTTWNILETEAGVILFIVNLADYVQVDGTGKNMLEGAHETFAEITDKKGINEKPVVLILNKCDLFREMIKTTPLSNHKMFSTMEPQRVAKGETDEDFFNRSCKEVFRLFRHTFRKNYKGEHSAAEVPIEYYVTCATDENFVENSMQKIMMSLAKRFLSHLKNNGFI